MQAQVNDTTWGSETSFEPRMSTTSPSDDDRWICRALELAARGRCGASPNPMVGAVVLDADGRLAGEGHHARCGGPHAELVALAGARERARGGTLYVTLEPCAHHGRTPPCVDAILAAGLARVVVALPDPNPTAAGGAERLRAAGVEVTVLNGAGAGAARLLNRRWLKAVRERRPWVTMKVAISIDGRIATATGESRWITGEEARARSLELREEHDAILVGVGTVLADDPRLTRRLDLNPGRGWRRVILDSTLRTPPEAGVVVSQPELTLIVHTAAADRGRRDRLAAAGVETVEAPADASGRVSAAAVLDLLGRREVTALLVEGGSEVHGSFVDADLVDEAVFFIAPLILGGPARCAVGGRGAETLAGALRLDIEAVERRGDDLEVRAVRLEETGVHGAD